MPPRQSSSSSSSDPSGRGEQRPTLPPIRQIFRGAHSPVLFFRFGGIQSSTCSSDELARSVPPQQARQSTSMSPHMSRLQLADEDPRYASRGAASPVPRPYTPGAPRSYPGYPDPSRPSSSSANHPRTSSDPASYHPATYPQGVPMPAYPQGYPPQYAQLARGPIPTGSYPYPGGVHPGMGMVASAPGPHHQPYHPHPEASANAQSASSRYECTYCGKGFTRPSSLKVCTSLPSGPLYARAFDLTSAPAT